MLLLSRSPTQCLSVQKRCVFKRINARKKDVVESEATVHSVERDYGNADDNRRAAGPQGTRQGARQSFGLTQRHVERQQWQKMQKPVGAYFERDHYEHCIYSHHSDSDVMPLLKFAHFPHPLQVVKDLADRGKHGAGVQINDKNMSCVVNDIARRIKIARKATEPNAPSVMEEVEKAELLQELCVERRGVLQFGTKSCTALLKCYAAAGMWAKVVSYYQHLEGRGQTYRNHRAAALKSIALCRQGQLVQAWEFCRSCEVNGTHQARVDHAQEEYLRVHCSTLLAESCAERHGAKGAALADEIVRYGQQRAPSGVFPAEVFSLAAFVAVQLRGMLDAPDKERASSQLAVYVVDHLALLSTTQSRSLPKLWAEMLVSIAEHSPAFCAVLMKLSPAEVVQDKHLCLLCLQECLAKGAVDAAIQLFEGFTNGVAGEEEDGEGGDVEAATEPQAEAEEAEASLWVLARVFMHAFRADTPSHDLVCLSLFKHAKVLSLNTEPLVERAVRMAKRVKERGKVAAITS